MCFFFFSFFIYILVETFRWRSIQSYASSSVPIQFSIEHTIAFSRFSTVEVTVLVCMFITFFVLLVSSSLDRKKKVHLSWSIVPCSHFTLCSGQTRVKLRRFVIVYVIFEFLLLFCKISRDKLCANVQNWLRLLVWTHLKHIFKSVRIG